MERCLIFAEPGLEDLISLVPYFQIEGSELMLAAFTVVPVDAVGVAEVDGGFMREDSGKIAGGTVDRLEESASFH
jgi:hypothetical protein